MGASDIRQWALQSRGDVIKVILISVSMDESTSGKNLHWPSPLTASLVGKDNQGSRVHTGRMEWQRQIARIIGRMNNHFVDEVPKSRPMTTSKIWEPSFSQISGIFEACQAIWIRRHRFARTS